MVDYLQQIIDKNANVSIFDASRKLALVFCEFYDFSFAKIFETNFIVAKPNMEIPIYKMVKHHADLENKLGVNVTFVFEDVSSYKIQKLFEEKVPFVVPGKQMYLPFLGIHFTKTKEKAEKTYGEKFTPSEQLVFLYILYSYSAEFTQGEIAKNLGLSPISVSRAMERLVKMRLVTSRTEGATGRKFVYRPVGKSELYENGRDCLMNPTREIFYAKNVPEKIAALKTGISALAQNTLLSDDGVLCIAVAKNQVEGFKRVPSEVGIEEKLPKVFVMKYDVSLLQKDSCTDPLTTIMVLSKKDDRIEIAISEMMKEYEWYKD